MAIIKKDSTDESETLNIEINNGDLKALGEIVETWNLKDKESALRFALAVLKVSSPGSLINDKDGSKKSLIPGETLIKEKE